MPLTPRKGRTTSTSVAASGSRTPRRVEPIAPEPAEDSGRRRTRSTTHEVANATPRKEPFKPDPVAVEQPKVSARSPRKKQFSETTSDVVPSPATRTRSASNAAALASNANAAENALSPRRSARKRPISVTDDIQEESAAKRPPVVTFEEQDALEELEHLEAGAQESDDDIDVITADVGITEKRLEPPETEDSKKSPRRRRPSEREHLEAPVRSTRIRRRSERYFNDSYVTDGTAAHTGQAYAAQHEESGYPVAPTSQPAANAPLLTTERSDLHIRTRRRTQNQQQQPAPEQEAYHQQENYAQEAYGTQQGEVVYQQQQYVPQKNRLRTQSGTAKGEYVPSGPMIVEGQHVTNHQQLQQELQQHPEQHAEQIYEMGAEALQEGEVFYDEDGNIIRLEDIQGSHVLYEEEIIDENGLPQRVIMIQEQPINDVKVDEHGQIVEDYEMMPQATHQMPKRGQPPPSQKKKRPPPVLPQVDEDGEPVEPPPVLEPESGPAPEDIMMAEEMERTGHHPGTKRGPQNEEEYVPGEGELIRVQTPGGTEQYVQLPPGETVTEDTIFVDENGDIIENAQITSHGGGTAPGVIPGGDLRNVEFNFLDHKNICCGLCGEIVPYDSLMSEHLPVHHPEVMGEGTAMDLEEVPYEEWLRDKLYNERKSMETGFRNPAMYADGHRIARSTRMLRKVSQVRVNPNEMTLKQLDDALKRKMVEKMGRQVPVTLVDKQHARCGLCSSVVSLNKKFEVVHLVRHFNAWHPSAHKCAGTWNRTQYLEGQQKPLSMQDFAVIDPNIGAGDNLQCIWCGMFMDTGALAMHFHEVHPDEVEVPKCQLCLQELVINARLMEKFGEDFEITLPDEHHLRCGKFNVTFMSEKSLEAGIEKRLIKLQNGEELDPYDNEDEETQASQQPEAYLNSRMSFGRRNKPKRHFVMPALRQAAPMNSKLVEPVTECHWKCRICHNDILAAVISAGAIRHYRSHHPELLEDLQTELCKARLERVSDGCMELVGPSTIECLICNLQYTLHRPYNMCRAIRHLKTKHPSQMPEYAGLSEEEKNALSAKEAPVATQSTSSSSSNYRKPTTRRSAAAAQAKQEADDAEQPNARTADLNAIFDANVTEGQPTEVTDEETLALLRETYNLDFQKVQAVIGPDGEKMIVLMDEDEDIPPETLEQLTNAEFVANAEDPNAPHSIVKEGAENEALVAQPHIETAEDVTVEETEEEHAEQQDDEPTVEQIEDEM
ncbi:hypothetical protein QR680_018063 [Steinernema hermaphroditum]|uniref:C2H2-type domain-containing protein n=1 Tax=Steinernema hermaphroditum TaxID=289476 RepID=A0AA39HHR0_9BILA|nr:hypothetical protein QR680_018063 [Steinernema hermaphroditum]